MEKSPENDQLNVTGHFQSFFLFIFSVPPPPPRHYIWKKISVNQLIRKFWLNAKNLNLLHPNNEGTDQPVHPCSLISAFVIHYLECIVETSIF